MPLRVGPYYDGTESDMLTIDTTQCRTRKPSVELLESVHLRPTYVSFPSPRCGGRTPTLPAFRFPQYGYSSVDEYENSDGEQDTAFSPKSFIDENDPISRQVTVLGGIINCTSFFMGVGILGLPYALRLSGWFGLTILVGLGFIMRYTAGLLGKCQYRYSLDSYPDIVEVAFGTAGRITVSIIFYFQLLFEVTVFMMLLTTSLALLSGADKYKAALFSTCIFTVVANICTSVYITNWLSLIGAVSSLALFLCLLIAFSLKIWQAVAISRHYAATNMGLNSWNSIGNDTSDSNSDREVIHLLSSSLSYPSDSWWWLILRRTEIFTEIKDFIYSFGIYSYCYMGHAALPSIFRGMNRQSQFPVVIDVTFAIMLISYVIISCVAYIAYGQRVRDNIILNITPDSFLHVGVNVLVVVIVIIKFALAAVPITESLFDWLKSTYCSRVMSPRKPSNVMDPANFDRSSSPTLFSRRGLARAKADAKQLSRGKFSHGTGDSSMNSGDEIANSINAFGVSAEDQDSDEDDEDDEDDLEKSDGLKTSKPGLKIPIPFDFGSGIRQLEKSVGSSGVSEKNDENTESPLLSDITSRLRSLSKSLSGSMCQLPHTEDTAHIKTYSQTHRVSQFMYSPPTEYTALVGDRNRSSSSAVDAPHMDASCQTENETAFTKSSTLFLSSYDLDTSNNYSLDLIGTSSSQFPSGSNRSLSLFTAREGSCSPSNYQKRFTQSFVESTSQSPKGDGSKSLKVYDNLQANDFDAESNLPSMPAKRVDSKSKKSTPLESDTSSLFLPSLSPSRRFRARRINYGRLCLHTLVRTLLPLISLALSHVFPQLSTILFFIGGIFGSVIAIIIPSLCYLRIFRREISCYEKFGVSLSTLIGISCTMLTVYVAVTR